MILEEIHEPIEVITVFENGRMHPIKFRWRKVVYKISHVNGKWMTFEGGSRCYHYSVMAGGPDCFEICFYTDKMRWELVRVGLEG